MKRYLILCLLLAGCGSAPPVVQVPDIPVVKETVNIPPSTLEPCPALQPLPTTKALTQTELLKGAKPWFDAYTLCSERQAAAAGIIRKAFNIEAPNEQAGK